MLAQKTLRDDKFIVFCDIATTDLMKINNLVRFGLRSSTNHGTVFQMDGSKFGARNLPAIMLFVDHGTCSDFVLRIYTVISNYKSIYKCHAKPSSKHVEALALRLLSSTPSRPVTILDSSNIQGAHRRCCWARSLHRCWWPLDPQSSRPTTAHRGHSWEQPKVVINRWFPYMAIGQQENPYKPQCLFLFPSFYCVSTMFFFMGLFGYPLLLTHRHLRLLNHFAGTSSISSSLQLGFGPQQFSKVMGSLQPLQGKLRQGATRSTYQTSFGDSPRGFIVCLFRFCSLFSGKNRSPDKYSWTHWTWLSFLVDGGFSGVLPWLFTGVCTTLHLGLHSNRWPLLVLYFYTFWSEQGLSQQNKHECPFKAYGKHFNDTSENKTNEPPNMPLCKGWGWKCQRFRSPRNTSTSHLATAHHHSRDVRGRGSRPGKRSVLLLDQTNR